MIRPAALLALPLLLPACDRAETERPTAARPVTAAEPAVGVGEPAARGTVVIVTVDGVEPGGEPVDVALQSEEQWTTEEAAYRARVPATAARVALRFAGVRPGRYAALAVQPNVPDPRDTEATDTLASAPIAQLPSLKAGPSGGRGVSSSGAVDATDFFSAVVEVQPNGATLPLTLQRR